MLALPLPQKSKRGSKLLYIHSLYFTIVGPVCVQNYIEVSCSYRGKKVKAKDIFDSEPQHEDIDVLELDKPQRDVAYIVHGEIETSANLDYTFDYFTEQRGHDANTKHTNVLSEEREEQ
jgi:hypothetical protein